MHQLLITHFSQYTKLYWLTPNQIWRTCCYDRSRDVRLRELHTDRLNCFSVHTHLILIAFLRILIAYLRKYAAYLGCCTYQSFPIILRSFRYFGGLSGKSRHRSCVACALMRQSMPSNSLFHHSTSHTISLSTVCYAEQALLHQLQTETKWTGKREDGRV